MLARIVAALISGLLASTAAQAQMSEEYAVMGKKAWVAFECSTLVDKTKNADERQRLFNLGYTQGKAFVEAWQRGRVEREDVAVHVPVGLLDKLEPWVNPQLPTVDFRLGAIWESAARNVLERIRESDAPELFASEYHRRNCSLL
jgi:hypothetical protein